MVSSRFLRRTTFFLHDSVTRSCRLRGTLSAKTIPDSVNVVWSISSAGLPPPLSLSDSASPDPSRLKPTAYRLPLFMLAGDGSFMGISSNFKISLALLRFTHRFYDHAVFRLN